MSEQPPPPQPGRHQGDHPSEVASGYPQPGQQQPGQLPPGYPQPAQQQPGQQGYPAQGHPAPGYPVPGGYQKPPKKRPNRWWFLVGGLLMVVGIAIGVATFATAYSSATQQDGVITANGRPATINAPAGEKRMLFVPSGQRAPSCELVDGTGKKLLVRPIFGDATLGTGGTEWQVFSQVESSGDGKVTLTCTPTTSGDGTQVQVRMGAPIDARTLGGRVIGGFAALLLLGGAGFVVLLVTTILWFSRKPVPQPLRGQP
jgi:hypothetical protein